MKHIENLLKDYKIRPTPMRMLMYKLLKETEVAMALNDIEIAFDRSERTTIYRTIKTFEKKGLVHQIDDGTGIAKYALGDEKLNENIRDLHLHFHCSECNETVCLTDHKIPHISLPEGFVSEDMNLVIKGLCEKCSGK